MSKVLYIKANSKNKGESKTFDISDYFIEKYTLKNPQDEIEILDLYNENIRFLTNEDLEGHKNPSLLNKEILKYVEQFLNSDKIVISAPFWNLSIPAILKAYIDYICVSGLTFKYTQKGPVGLCENKKIIHVVTRGGDYSSERAMQYEMGDRYLRAIFGFLGITDFTTVSADNLDVIGANKEKIMEDAKEKIIGLLDTF